MDKIREAREHIAEKYYSHKRAGGISMETFETIQTALKAFEALCEDEWQDISTAPKDGTRIKAKIGDKIVICRFVRSWLAEGWTIYKLTEDKKDHFWKRGIETWLCVRPTHWKPLETPAEKIAAEFMEGE